MWYKILRFLGAIIAAYIFVNLVEWISCYIFLQYIGQVTNYVWADWFKLSSLVISVGFTSILAVGIVLCKLVKGGFWMAILPILYFFYRLIFILNAFFYSNIVDNIVAKYYNNVSISLYNFGSIVTFAFILFCYVFCSIKMIKWKE